MLFNKTFCTVYNYHQCYSPFDWNVPVRSFSRSIKVSGCQVTSTQMMWTLRSLCSPAALLFFTSTTVDRWSQTLTSYFLVTWAARSGSLWAGFLPASVGPGKGQREPACERSHTAIFVIPAKSSGREQDTNIVLWMRNVSLQGLIRSQHSVRVTLYFTGLKQPPKPVNIKRRILSIRTQQQRGLWAIKEWTVWLMSKALLCSFDPEG